MYHHVIMILTTRRWIVLLNNYTCIGRVTKDLELKQTGTEKANVRFSVAVQRSFKNGDGNYDADFIPCVAWGTRAVAYSNNLKKGSLISVTGSLRSRDYIDPQDGKKIFILELQVDEIDFLEKKPKETEFKLSEDPFR